MRCFPAVPIARAFRMLLVALAVGAVAPLWATASAQVGSCSSIDPPCPPPPPMAINVQSITDTVHVSPVNVTFTLTNIPPGQLTLTSIVNGGTGPTPAFSPDAGGGSGYGSVTLTPPPTRVVRRRRPTTA